MRQIKYIPINRPKGAVIMLSAYEAMRKGYSYERDGKPFEPRKAS